ncbi:MAG: hypothetical protein LBR16_09845 [Treponema sp.]|jgi:hypothetical protein|nr:hypothetical protein [Treponema sp.]
MGTTWKPVQPTEIKDLRIVKEVIAQIRKPIPPEVYERIAREDALLRAAFKPGPPLWAKKKG